jgi:hypothetical protein
VQKDHEFDASQGKISHILLQKKKKKAYKRIAVMIQLVQHLSGS